MGEDKSGKLKEKDNRPILGNITNQLGKRPFSLISTSQSSSKSKSENTNTINVADDTDTDSSFWKQVSLVVEKLEKERSTSSAKCPKVVNEVGLSPLKGGKTYRLLNSSNTAKKGVGFGLRNVVHDTKEPSSSALDSIDLDSAVNVGDAAKEGCEEKMGEGFRSCDKEEESKEEVSDSVVHGVEEGLLSTQTVVDDNVTMNRGGDCVATSRVRGTEMKGFGLERCAALKGEVGVGGGCSFSAGVDTIKDCSCSFCTKAAYIWSDLHYQDVKSRMSTLGKSMKEASNLAQKYNSGTEMGSHASENATNVEQLESDLMHKWRSLFLHMEDILASEGSQLEKQLLALKDLREDFKMNLEMTTGVPVDVQQSSSDGSDHTT